MTLRKLLIVGAVLAIAVPAAAHGTTRRSSGVNVRRLANLYQIDQLEVKWHKATSKKDLALMMSIMAPNVRLQSNGATYVGKAAVRNVFARAAPFQPQNRWVSDTPAYKIRATVNGNRGTLYFEWPLHRRRDGQGRRCRRRRQRRPEDPRQVAVHEADPFLGHSEAMTSRWRATSP
jgi:ketosteroid isomerase-like protein